jgi:hypothetical protein
MFVNINYLVIELMIDVVNNYLVIEMNLFNRIELLWCYCEYCDIVEILWYEFKILLRYCEYEFEILWYEFETCIGFKNCTCFEFNFLICSEPIDAIWIKSADTNNLILVSAYLFIIGIGCVRTADTNNYYWYQLATTDTKNVQFFISYR